MKNLCWASHSEKADRSVVDEYSPHGLLRLTHPTLDAVLRSAGYPWLYAERLSVSIALLLKLGRGDRNTAWIG